MDPMTFGTTFASIVGLLGMWKSEVGERKKQSLGEYLEWLRRKEHNQLAELIEGNSELSTSLRVLVEDQHGQVMGKLTELDKILSGIASHIADFQPLANAVRVESGLSDQAVSILRQMNEANINQFLEVKMRGGAQYVPLQHRSAKLTIDDPRFIEDDLLTLVELGLLRLDFNDRGGRIFTTTRAGAAVGG